MCMNCQYYYIYKKRKQVVFGFCPLRSWTDLSHGEQSQFGSAHMHPLPLAFGHLIMVVQAKGWLKDPSGSPLDNESSLAPITSTPYGSQCEAKPRTVALWPIFGTSSQQHGKEINDFHVDEFAKGERDFEAKLQLQSTNRTTQGNDINDETQQFISAAASLNVSSTDSALGNCSDAPLA
ncbi:hypothetical protein V6N13_120400 [Hibiscus sabdariffa]|uniref:Uncharacterized protein n=1 Tax=Hibiscus sabdariffa TaxID=183260 RepID=A0ABR2E4K0_9ROSI